MPIIQEATSGEGGGLVPPLCDREGLPGRNSDCRGGRQKFGIALRQVGIGVADIRGGSGMGFRGAGRGSKGYANRAKKKFGKVWEFLNLIQRETPSKFHLKFLRKLKIFLKNYMKIIFLKIREQLN